MPSTTILLALALAVVHSEEHSPTAFSCATDLDCNLNGICSPSTGACACDAAWDGPSCGILALLPSTPGDGDCDASLNGTATGYTTTWGGHPMQDAAGAWHIHNAEM